MSGIISWETQFFLISIALGCKLMLIYDGLRILRMVLPHKPFVRDLEDLAYWIFCALHSFAMMYRENDGSIRWFSLAGIAMGMILWQLIFTKSLKKMIVWVKIKVKAKERK